MLSGYQFIVGGIILILCGLLLGGRMGAVSASAIGILVYLAFVSAVAYSLWGTALKIQSGIEGGSVRIHESGVRCDLIRMAVG